ncbi:general transcription factor 3C polypeptide 6-like [Palaemon carinicauda]|uniref:general transcription factor 3C polypeptide 6-like n=1 Tax=Palaemon carinicauda TaxID=392227 RepID=UPI0035B58DDB
MADSDSEYEEEETLIAVELHGVIDSEIFAQDSFSKFKILAIDSEQPILQVENFVFTGGYEHAMGTNIFFEEDEKKVKKCDPVFCKKPARMLKYVCKTNKKLNMKRVFVSEKTSGEENNMPGSSESDSAADPSNDTQDTSSLEETENSSQSELNTQSK